MEKIIEILAPIEQELIYVLRIIVAGFCGLVVGYERKRRQKEAGIRTHFIVSAGAALVMAISTSFASDPSRIAAQIVSGIGFLGAGMIFFRRESLHGLTTAAGIWTTAGIGMAAGAGLYVLAILSTLVIFFAQTIFHSKLMPLKYDYSMLLIKFDYTQKTVAMLKEYFDVDKFSRFKAIEDGSRIKVEAVIRTKINCSAGVIVAFISENENIHTIERLEDL